MANIEYAAIDLIGGTDGAIDKLDGVGLADKDFIITAVKGNKAFCHVLNATSGESESSPEKIAPDTNPGTKVWEEVRFNGAHRSLIVLGSDAVNNNAVANTLQDATGLSFPIKAGVAYRFHFHLCVTSASTSTGARYVLSGPAAPTAFAVSYSHPTAATTATMANSVDYTTPASAATSSLLTNIVLIDGFIVPSVDGTIQLQFASETANVAITIKAGSTIEVW